VAIGGVGTADSEVKVSHFVECERMSCERRRISRLFYLFSE